MPLFDKPRALFVHIPKNGGRSIESALLPPPLTPDSGRRTIPNRAAHYLQSLTGQHVADERLLGTLDVSLAAQHLTLAEIELLGLVPAKTLKDVFKFCVVREPYSRTISSVLHFKKRFADQLTLSDTPDARQMEYAIAAWLDIDPPDHNVAAHRRPQAAYVAGHASALKVDEILRFERLNADFDALMARLGAGERTLPWVGRQQHLRNSDDLYTPGARKAVARAFEIDFDTFGYPTAGAA